MNILQLKITRLHDPVASLPKDYVEDDSGMWYYPYVVMVKVYIILFCRH